MRILAYKGKSITSWLIKFQTRSKYSHIAIQLTDGAVIEAWQSGGVRRIANPFIDHKSGTEIDVFDIIVKFDEQTVEDYLYSAIGQGYDYNSVFRFVTRKNAPTNEEKFCSELAELAMIEGGLSLLNGNPSHHSPRDTMLSPYLKFRETIK
jgi:uncharacterized protein YycO